MVHDRWIQYWTHINLVVARALASSPAPSEFHHPKKLRWIQRSAFQFELHRLRLRWVICDIEFERTKTTAKTKFKKLHIPRRTSHTKPHIFQFSLSRRSVRHSHFIAFTLSSLLRPAFSVLNFGDPTELTPSTPRNLCGAETIPDTSYFTDLQAFLKLEQDYICIFAISSIDIKLLTWLLPHGAVSHGFSVAKATHASLTSIKKNQNLQSLFFPHSFYKPSESMSDIRIVDWGIISPKSRDN